MNSMDEPTFEYDSGFTDGVQEGKRQLQAENDRLKKLLHYLSGMQTIDDAKHNYPIEHQVWADGQEKGDIIGDFSYWLIEQALKGDK